MAQEFGTWVQESAKHFSCTPRGESRVRDGRSLGDYSKSTRVLTSLEPVWGLGLQGFGV